MGSILAKFYLDRSALEYLAEGNSEIKVALEQSALNWIKKSCIKPNAEIREFARNESRKANEEFLEGWQSTLRKETAEKIKASVHQAFDSELLHHTQEIREGIIAGFNKQIQEQVDRVLDADRIIKSAEQVAYKAVMEKIAQNLKNGD
jgi:hypothetical protein